MYALIIWKFMQFVIELFQIFSKEKLNFIQGFDKN